MAHLERAILVIREAVIDLFLDHDGYLHSQLELTEVLPENWEKPVREVVAERVLLFVTIENALLSGEGSPHQQNCQVQTLHHRVH